MRIPLKKLSIKRPALSSKGPASPRLPLLGKLPSVTFSFQLPRLPHIPRLSLALPGGKGGSKPKAQVKTSAKNAAPAADVASPAAKVKDQRKEKDKAKGKDKKKDTGKRGEKTLSHGPAPEPDVPAAALDETSPAPPDPAKEEAKEEAKKKVMALAAEKAIKASDPATLPADAPPPAALAADGDPANGATPAAPGSAEPAGEPPPAEPPKEEKKGGGMMDDLMSLFDEDAGGDSEIGNLAADLEDLDIRALADECKDVAQGLAKRIAEGS